MKRKKSLSCTIISLVLAFALLMSQVTPSQVTVEAADVSDLVYECLSGGFAYVSGCNPDASGELVIPELIDGCQVVAVEDGTFAWCTRLTSVTLPTGLYRIGQELFYGCTGLTNVTIPDSVKYIERSAFSGCTSLPGITIPESVKEIDADAFLDCSALSVIEFKGDAPAIDSTAFSNVSACVFYPADNTTWNDSNKIDYGGNLKWYSCGKEEITDSGECGDSLTWSLENGTLRITGTGAMDDYSLYGKGEVAPWYALRGIITSVELPAELPNIGNYAFYGCNTLEKIQLPAAVKVGDYAFKNCKSLKEITIPKKASIGKQAFCGCDALEHVVISNSATTFSEGCFKDCPLLVTAGPVGGDYSIELGWQEKIPDFAFYDCDSLISVTIPDGVMFVGEQSFFDCNRLQNITIPDSVTYFARNSFGIEIKETVDNNLRKFYFLGSAPAMHWSCFINITAIVYYPYGYTDWEGIINQNYGGTDITWEIYNYGNPVSLKITTKPNTTAYKVGDTLDITGLQAVLVHDSGYEMPLETDDLTIEKVDFSTPGEKTVTVQYADFTTTFEIVVNEVETILVDVALYPESEHGYEANLNDMQEFTYEGAFALTITFSQDTFTEANIDFIYLYDENNNLIAQYTGSQAAGKSVEISGDTFRIQLVSDADTSGFGYAFDSIVANVIKEPKQGGDVNGDDAVNAKDVASLRRYLAGGWDVAVDETALDINGDGSVNAKDVATLRRYLAGGWDVTLG